MRYVVKWSPEAEHTYKAVLEYLLEKWTVQELDSFINRTDEVINFIVQNPQQYIYSKSKQAYRAVLTKQVSLYYRLNQHYIELLLFWDNRNNPANLKL